MCDPYIWQDISVFPKALAEIFPPSGNALCTSQLTNTIVIWYLLGMLFGIPFIALYKTVYPAGLLILIITLFLIPVFLSYGRVCEEPVKAPMKKEAFTVPTPFPERPTAPPLTQPTARNPFMNVLIDEIKYNPTKPAAADITTPMMKTTLDDFFRVEFTSDPTDVFGRSQSQRQFISMPSSTIPNDVGSFQNWLYKIPGKTCKEGGREACLPGTDGGQLPWLNVER
jgi:hypothetical protein